MNFQRHSKYSNGDGVSGSDARRTLPARLLLLLCLCGLMCSVAAAQSTPTNLGPIRTVFQDEIGQTISPANPPSGNCRHYYNTSSGTEVWIDSTGSNCGPVSSNVANPGCSGQPVAYYPSGLIASITGDCFFTTDGVGNGKLKSLTGTDTTYAGFFNLINGPKPPQLNLLNGAQQYAVANSGASSEWVACNINNIRYAQCFNWTALPTSPTTLAIGSNTVTLAPCPMGVDTSNDTTAPYYVYVATTGTAEPVRVTGGTCTPGATSGTIIFTAVNAHSAGYSLQSASGGIKEAIDDAGSPDSKVIIGPTGANVNAIQVYAPIFINKNRIEISAEGAHVKCFTRSRCMQSGDTAVATDWNIIKIRGLRFESMINIDGVQVTNVSRTSNITTVTTAAAHNFSMTGNAGGPDVIWINYYTIASNIPNYHGYCILASVIDSTHFTCAGQSGSNFSSGAVFGWTALNNAAIEDDAENTTMQDIALLTTGSPRFHNFIVVDNDQAAKVINLATDSSGVRCNANFCGSIVTTRSDNGNAGILTVDKSEISLQCQGNAISALASNLVSIHDTVIQGFQQWGVRYEGGISSVLIDGSYIQGDGCTNPLYSGSLGASVGLITTTATVKGANLPLGGLTPTFANTGATQRNYYVVPQQLGAFAAGPFLYAGSALTNGAGTVTVQWPQVPGDGGGVVTYDLLITTGASASAPYAGSATSIATGITSANCSNGICSFSDTLGAGSAYTYAFNGHSGFGYAPDVWLWPSGIMLLAGPGIFPNVYMDQPVFTQSVAGPTGVSVSARGCSSTLASIWVQCEVSGPASAVQLGAEVLQQEDNSGNGASQFASKGRTIYQYGGAHGAYDIVTFIDSNTDKTLATPGNRPAADAADSAVGVDTSNVGAGLAGLAWRTPVSHSWYINSLPDGSSWKGRLTNTLLKWVVPTQITEITFASLTGSITCNAGAAGTKRPISDSTVLSVGTTIAGGGANHVEAYCNGTNWVVGSGGTGGSGLANNLAGGATGSLPYQSAVDTTAMLAGNTAATDQVLVSHGTGAAAQAPTLSNAPALSAANMTSFPTLNQNTSGTAANLSGTPALPNGTSATTQAQNSNDTKLATDAYVDRVIATPLFTGNAAVNSTRVTADYTQSTATNTQIAGLSWTLPANTAATYKFDCNILGSQATAATLLTFSMDDLTIAPSAGVAWTEAGMTAGAGWIAVRSATGFNATGSKTLVTFTPTTTATTFHVGIHGQFTQPSNASTSVFQIELGVGGGTNVVTILQDSACAITTTAN